MNTRCLLLTLCLAPLWLALGCSGLEPPQAEEPRGADEKPKAGELPQAPPPHLKKRTAELLVGRWNRVTFLGKPLRPGSAVVNEFTQDGKFIFVITNPRTGRSVNTGVYRVAGNTIQLTSDATPDYPSKTWEVTIKSISETELATASGPPTEIQQSTYKRVEK